LTLIIVSALVDSEIIERTNSGGNTLHDLDAGGGHTCDAHGTTALAPKGDRRLWASHSTEGILEITRNGSFVD